MPSELYRCVYYSKNLIAGGSLRIAEEIESILAAARRNNPPLSVTGALVFNRGLFAQVLEGPCPSVESLFEKILRDERHGDIQVLGFGAARERLFSNWSMAFLGRSREDQDLFGHFGRQTGFNAERIEGDRLLEIVRHLAFEEEARAA
ncbi:BLUF domain-containing protein [Rhodopseudomonas palustris]|uniref:BLUF domain-containing protein n=1 Tax=Rhodopseudomonas palustris TaxID=1076 RepID=A0AAX3DZI6_RHOPL|nr:BLUF domain-containing protein [Rhodopseudomonas palustris]AVT79406.1 blue-light sensor BLUF [Rhodopseudomonas palustris]UYO40242.1 BLUF domain-containing protein [Rhodopseudomonas palustris]UYO44960.1 BLUF domain-containing protein [Rhodopseudomonas palustris]UYO49552.1 BLUF domain-containing protein [Rhodopseudomonas palustris]UYO54351.1 BLUF domain-containing protein [Rhodopseudomonas palustris]